MGRTLSLLSLAAAAAVTLTCSNGQTSAASATPADAKTFLDTANETTLKVGIEASRAGWVQQTFITDDTEALSARANQLANEAGARFAKEATKYDKVDLPADQRRQLLLLKTSLVLATPGDPKESDELSKIMARLESTYGKGKWCTDPANPATCKNTDEVTKIMASSRDVNALRAAWDGWHTIAPPMKKDYQRFVELSNKGARELGFAPLPKTFWERSLFVRPRDRDVVCHASAWDVDYVEDVRIKMCIEPTAEDFMTIHHELGHNFYQRAYSTQPVLFRDGANDGFHEAIGDTIALSVTPDYLVKIGLLGKAPDTSRDIGLLMDRALEKIAFLPFGLLIDQWRWKVFAGEVTPDQYNKAWWDLRLKYQGVAPPSARGEEFFDPGAKYHVPDNTPYTRYFLAAILQFQFHRAMAKIAGCTLPLNRCSTYDNQDAGRRLNAMLAMGASRPWQDALETLTGSKQMDATAILDYFAPLSAWLDSQLAGKPVGW